MKRRLTAAAAALLVTSLGSLVNAAEPKDDVAAVVALDKELSAAFVEKALPVVDRILLDDFVLTTANARVATKADLMKQTASPDVVLTVNESTEVKVRVHGDTAVLTGILHQKGTIGGKAYEARVRYTDTWIRSGASWKQLSGHASLLLAAS